MNGRGRGRRSGGQIDFRAREHSGGKAFAPVGSRTLDAVFDDIAPYYDVASDVASLGLCSAWRRRFTDSVALVPGDRVLDVCAGTNGVGLALLRREPGIAVTAFDRNAAMQAVGRRLARERGVAIGSVIGDAHYLPFPDGHFDVVTLQFASRHLSVLDAFAEVRRVLRPGGSFYHCDMLRPENRLVETLYGVYLKGCVSVTALAFGSGPEAWSCRDYFVQAIRMFYSAAEIGDLLRHVGFSAVTSRVAVGGVLAWHRAVKA